MSVSNWFLIGIFAALALVCLQPIKLWKALTTEIRNWKLPTRRRFFGRE